MPRANWSAGVCLDRVAPEFDDRAPGGRLSGRREAVVPGG